MITLNSKNIFVDFALRNSITDNWKQPRDICSLFNKFVKSFFACCFAYGLLIMSVVSALFVLLVGTHMYFTTDSLNVLQDIQRGVYNMFTMFMLWGIGSLFFIFAIGLMMAYSAIEDLYRATFRPKNKSNNMFKEWVKAKRDKLCPLVEYK